MMNNPNTISQTQDDHKKILGGLSLALVVAAALVALWRGSFVGTLNADFASFSGDQTGNRCGANSATSQSQSGHAADVILVPEQVSTIQGAIDQASDGSVIFVAPGQYRESIFIHGKNISLQASGGSATVCILGSGRGGPIALIENAKCMIDGFRIQDGRGENGRGLTLQSSDATIVNCTFANNMGGVSVTNSKAQFMNCVIATNRSAIAGGGMWCAQSDVRMSDCAVNDNAAGTFGGGVYVQGGSLQLLNVSFINNRVQSGAWGGGLYSDRANVNLNACVMRGNFSHDSGAAIYVLDANAKIRGSTFERNSSTGAATVVGANAQFDIQDSILEQANETVAVATSDSAVIEMAEANAMETGAMMMAVK